MLPAVSTACLTLDISRVVEDELMQLWGIHGQLLTEVLRCAHFRISTHSHTSELVPKLTTHGIQGGERQGLWPPR